MKKELDKSKASFKLDLAETANADPMVSPADLKVLLAYASVIEWPSCKAWLTASMAMAKTGLSDRQFRESRKRLLGKNIEKRAYLFPVRKGGKIATYMLINPWRDEALELIDAKLAYHREVERQRKAASRASTSRQNLPGHEAGLSRQNVPGQNGVVPAKCSGTEWGCPGKICRSVPAKSAANIPLENPPKKKGSREEETSGSNVVPFKNGRKAS